MASLTGRFKRSMAQELMLMGGIVTALTLGLMTINHVTKTRDREIRLVASGVESERMIDVVSAERRGGSEPMTVPVPHAIETIDGLRTISFQAVSRSTCLTFLRARMRLVPSEVMVNGNAAGLSPGGEDLCVDDLRQKIGDASVTTPKGAGMIPRYENFPQNRIQVVLPPSG